MATAAEIEELADDNTFNQMVRVSLIKSAGAVALDSTNPQALRDAAGDVFDLVDPTRLVRLVSIYIAAKRDVNLTAFQAVATETAEGLIEADVVDYLRIKAGLTTS